MKPSQFTAINTAIAVGEPLLVTREPGAGKTQTAYYAAYKLNVDAREVEIKKLTPEFRKMAVQRSLALRDRNLRKSPAAGELLIWLKVLSTAVGSHPEKQVEDLSKLSYPGLLLKDHQDIRELGGAI